MATRASGGETRARIIAAAERLFAEQGFDRVTLRQIARESGQGNVAAVQYHFGSKEGLLSAIVDRHRGEIDDRRRALLAAAEASDAEPDLEALVRILVEPLAGRLDDASGRAYLRIQAQGLTNDKMRPATRSLMRRIGEHIGSIDHAPEAPESPHLARFALLLLFHALADRAEAETAGRVRRSERDGFVRALTRSLERLLAG